MAIDNRTPKEKVVDGYCERLEAVLMELTNVVEVLEKRVAKLEQGGRPYFPIGHGGKT